MYRTSSFRSKRMYFGEMLAKNQFLEFSKRKAMILSPIKTERSKLPLFLHLEM